MIVIQPTTQISDWAAERERLGLIVERAEVITDPKTGAMLRVDLHLADRTRSGEPICIAGDALHLAQQQAAAHPNQRPRSKLAEKLADLHARAAQHPGARQQMTLPSGLSIHTIVGKDGMTRLMLVRQDCYPSDVEWVTVVVNWPYDPPDIVYEKFKHQKNLCLRSEWKTPVGIFLKNVE